MKNLFVILLSILVSATDVKSQYGTKPGLTFKTPVSTSGNIKDWKRIKDKLIKDIMRAHERLMNPHDNPQPHQMRIHQFDSVATKLYVAVAKARMGQYRSVVWNFEGKDSNLPNRPSSISSIIVTHLKLQLDRATLKNQGGQSIEISKDKKTLTWITGSSSRIRIKARYLNPQKEVFLELSAIKNWLLTNQHIISEIPTLLELQKM